MRVRPRAKTKSQWTTRSDAKQSVRVRPFATTSHSPGIHSRVLVSRAHVLHTCDGRDGRITPVV